MSATKEFGLAGIIGMPVAHSRSPVVHNYWLEEHGLAGRYVLLPVKPERLAEALKGLVALGFRGVNVTTPHKQAVMPLLDHVDPMATRIGAVNTIVVEPDGTLRGFNNDGNGFVQALRDEKPDWRPDDGPIVVVGAGGAARAILVALASQGAKEIRPREPHARDRRLARARARRTDRGRALGTSRAGARGARRR
jgi:shikimate dehydrogenase